MAKLSFVIVLVCALSLVSLSSAAATLHADYLSSSAEEAVRIAKASLSMYRLSPVDHLSFIIISIISASTAREPCSSPPRLEDDVLATSSIACSAA
jgi:hypothetical protein